MGALKQVISKLKFISKDTCIDEFLGDLSEEDTMRLLWILSQSNVKCLEIRWNDYPKPINQYWQFPGVDVTFTDGRVYDPYLFNEEIYTRDREGMWGVFRYNLDDIIREIG